MELEELMDKLPSGSIIQFGTDRDGAFIYFDNKADYLDNSPSFMQGRESVIFGGNLIETFTEFIERIVKEQE